MILMITMTLSLLTIPVYGEEQIQNSDVDDVMSYASIQQNAIDRGIDYLKSGRDEYNVWNDLDDFRTAYVIDVMEFLSESCISKNEADNLIDGVYDYYNSLYVTNSNDLSNLLLINEFHEDNDIVCLKNLQNPDGGFGLSDGYASDIIDTKLAMKALADVGETEAMNKAAKYIASLQNDDGGFSYQQGLESDPGLSAEIADVYGDCIIADQSIASDFSDTLNALEKYLDKNLPSLDRLSADNIPEVYQNFYTVLFRLKKGEKVDVSAYYALQAENGGVFDDPLATALFLEMIVREQNALTASIDHISITNDKGYSVSSFNANENVRKHGIQEILRQARI
jgi:hypothetical protein